MGSVKAWLMEKTTWAGFALLVTAIGTWITTGSVDGGEPTAKDQFISAAFLLVLKGRNLLGAAPDNRADPGLPKK